MRLAEKVALGYAYGSSLLSYLIDGAPRPFSATWAVTNLCNLPCSYCNCPFIDPTALDLPPIECVIIETPVPGVPYGLRGVGEVPIIPPAAAVANAIARATGKRMQAMPMTPERVLTVLKA